MKSVLLLWIRAPATRPGCYSGMEPLAFYALDHQALFSAQRQLLIPFPAANRALTSHGLTFIKFLSLKGP